MWYDTTKKTLDKSKFAVEFFNLKKLLTSNFEKSWKSLTEFEVNLDFCFCK